MEVYKFFYCNFYEYFRIYFTNFVELIFNVLLLVFLAYFIISKLKFNYDKLILNLESKKISLTNIIIKTLGFTYLNPHVYSDTVFFLGNFSKNFLIVEKYYFGFGASLASLLFFFGIGYLSKFLSKYLKNQTIWRFINIFIIVFMGFLAFYVLLDILNLS